MTNRYAIVENGVVTNVILWDGSGGGWTPPEGQTPIFLPGDSAVGIGYTYDGATFAAQEMLAAPLTPAQVISNNAALQASLMDAAGDATYGVADAYVAGLLSASDAATFKTWAAYKLALSKVDLTKTTPAWPPVPATSS